MLFSFKWGGYNCKYVYKLKECISFGINCKNFACINLHKLHYSIIKLILGKIYLLGIHSILH